MAPVGGGAREGGFDGRFPVLGAVEGDLQGDEAGSVEDVLVAGGFGGFGDVVEQLVEHGDCGAVVVGQAVELDDGHCQADIVGPFLEEGEDLLEAELGEIALGVGCCVEC